MCFGDRNRIVKALAMFAVKAECGSGGGFLNRVVKNHTRTFLRRAHQPRTTGNVAIDHPFRIKSQHGIRITRNARSRIAEIVIGANLGPGRVEHPESEAATEFIRNRLRDERSVLLSTYETRILGKQKIAARRLDR